MSAPEIPGPGRKFVLHADRRWDTYDCGDKYLPKKKDELILYLKTAPKGREAVEAVKERMLMGIETPQDDPMVFRVTDIVRTTPFEGRILDAGCYGGWLYHMLGKPTGYIGIDVWPEAIEAAKELFPEGDFRVCDLFDFKEEVDFAWSSQIAFDADKTMLAIEHLKSISKHGAYAAPSAYARKFPVGSFDEFGKTFVMRW